MVNVHAEYDRREKTEMRWRCARVSIRPNALHIVVVSTGPQHPSRVYDLIGDFEIGTLHPDDVEQLKKKR